MFVTPVKSTKAMAIYQDYGCSLLRLAAIIDNCRLNLDLDEDI